MCIRDRYKSKMKEYYQKAGIATARYHMVDDLESCRKFINEVGYPVVVKPVSYTHLECHHRQSDGAAKSGKHGFAHL